MLSRHLFFGRPLFLLPKLAGLAISHRWGLVLVSSSGRTTLVICFLGKFQQILCAPPSWSLHFWCGPNWSSLLPISPSSFRLNLSCSHFCSLLPNIQTHMSDSDHIVYISLWTPLTREQSVVSEWCHCRQFSISNLCFCVCIPSTSSLIRLSGLWLYSCVARICVPERIIFSSINCLLVPPSVSWFPYISIILSLSSVELFPAGSFLSGSVLSKCRLASSLFNPSHLSFSSASPNTVIRSPVSPHFSSIPRRVIVFIMHSNICLRPATSLNKKLLFPCTPYK